MKVSKRLAAALFFLSWTHLASAQTADEVVERCLTAAGGRAALAKVKSRSMTGTIVLSTPAGDITGSVEILNAVPNKSRSLIKADLTALGAGQLVLDQRFDGSSGYAIDTLQGNRDITGNQLDNMRNSTFPYPFLNYKEMGATDAESYLPLKIVMKIDVPQLGQELEQTIEFQDFRDVDGLKVAFRLVATSAVQNYTITFTFTKVEHNLSIDPAIFSKPGV